MLTLKQLEGRLRKRFIDGSHSQAESIADASGVMFYCPVCYEKNGGKVGTHQVICWFEGKVDDDASPGPGRWTPSPESTGIEDLTFVPGQKHKATSVHLTGSGGCGAHFHVKNGTIA